MNDGLFRLRWTNHTSTFTSLLEQFRLQGLFCDATVACDRKIFPVHQAVLSACSEFFFSLFASTRYQNPVIVLQDVGPSHIENLLLYMYSGEAKVPRQDLPDFMKVAESLQIKGLAVPSSPAVDENLRKQSVSNVSLENVPSYQRFSNTLRHFHPQPQSSNKSGCDNPEQHPLTLWQNPGQVDHDRDRGIGVELLNNSRIESHELENEGFVPNRIDPDRRQSLSEEQGDKPYYSGMNLHLANLKEENVPLFTSHCIYSPHESNCEMVSGIKEEAPDTEESYGTDFVSSMEDSEFRDDGADAKDLFIAEEDDESWNSQHQDDSLQEFDNMADEHVNVGNIDPPSQDGCESQLRRELLRPVHRKTSPIRLPWHKVQSNVPVTAPSKPQQQLPSLKPQQPFTLRPPQQRPTLRPQQPIPSLNPPQQPSSLRPPQQASSLRPPQQASSLRPPQQTSSLRPPQQASSIRPPQQLPSLRPPQQASSIRPPQQLPSLRPPQQLPPLRPPQHPPPLRLPQHPLREPPPLMKISSKISVQDDFSERDSQTMAMQESRDRGLHSTHLLVEAPPTYQSCIVQRQLAEFQVSNPNARSSSEQNMQPVPMSSRSSDVIVHMTASESPLNLSGQRSSSEGSEEVNREHVFEKVSGRRRRHRGPKSWEFLVRLIKDPATNPALIRWEDEASGTFRLVRPAIIAQRWGRRASKHANECLTYENFARGLRYHYATGALHPVSERNLVYRFGRTALALLRKYSSVTEPVPAPLTSIESGS